MTTDQTKEAKTTPHLYLVWATKTPQNRDYSPYKRLERHILLGGTTTSAFALKTLTEMSYEILGAPIKGDQWRTNRNLESWEHLLDSSLGTDLGDVIRKTTQELMIWGCVYGRESMSILHLGTKDQKEQYLRRREDAREERRIFGSSKIGQIIPVAKKCGRLDYPLNASNG
jgi:hypothetical protein